MCAFERFFHEAVSNQICDDLIELLDPQQITVTASFWVRGGITTVVTVSHHKDSESPVTLVKASERQKTDGAPSSKH